MTNGKLKGWVLWKEDNGIVKALDHFYSFCALRGFFVWNVILIIVRKGLYLPNVEPRSATGVEIVWTLVVASKWMKLNKKCDNDWYHMLWLPFNSFVSCKFAIVYKLKSSFDWKEFYKYRQYFSHVTADNSLLISNVKE